MKILMLVNWKVKYTDRPVENEQPMNYVVSGEPYWFFKYFREEPDVDVVDIRSLPPLESFARYKLHFYILQTLKVLPRLGEYDIILSHGMQSGIVLALIRRFVKTRAKHIVFDIGTFNSGAESGRAMKLMQFASHSIDGLICHASWQKTYYRQYYPWLADQAEFIPLGIESGILEKKSYLEYKGLDKTKPYMLCVGRDRCDWETVVAAYKDLDTDVRLCFLGGVDSRFEGKKNILMLPYVSFEEMLDLIRSAEFCILPIENVRFSFGQIRLLQQMAMGKCVVAPQTISLSDYGWDRESVLFYEPENVSSCRHAISLALRNPEYRELVGRTAAEEVRVRFTEARMAGQIEQYISHMTGKR